jgi:hypothetical protein
MPLHDWTRVTARIYHDFHNAWITELRNVLNDGLLPSPYYALGEQRSGDIGPDVLTLHADVDEPDGSAPPGLGEQEGVIAVAQSPPQVQMAVEAQDIEFYLTRQRTVVIRHATGDRVVAVLEIVSPANKHTRQTVDDFIDKVVSALQQGIHAVVIDPFPPGRHDPEGMHGAIWERLSEQRYFASSDFPLTLASYCARRPVKAYVEPARVGSILIDMPLFLTGDHYLRVPLESTYVRAWRGVPQRWRRVIEGDVAG